jgi:hypothetical protein
MTRQTRTVLLQCFNEEWILPWYLLHHKQIFDHGIVVDYHSTDRSREIVKEICPTWEVRTSRNLDYQADNVDAELMDIERSLTGWRMCLNAPEFLIGDYSILTDDPNQQFLMPQTLFVDRDYSQETTYDKPLWEQKNYGISYKDSRNTRSNLYIHRPPRSIHNMPIQYPTVGRHYYCPPTTDKLAIFYFGWCPMTEGQLQRKLQIQTQLPLIDRLRGYGLHNVTTKETILYNMKNEYIPVSADISDEIKHYSNLHNSTRL